MSTDPQDAPTVDYEGFKQQQTAAGKLPFLWIGGALLLGLILGGPCGIAIGWTIGKGSGPTPIEQKEKKDKDAISPRKGAAVPDSIEGIYKRTTKGERDSRIEKIEFKANGLVVINDDRKTTGTYRYNNGAVTISPGAFEMVGEMEGNTLHLRGEIFTKQ